MGPIYEPGEDSYLAQKYVSKYSNVELVLDMGTGTGIQAITAAKNAKNVIAVDINPEAITQSKLQADIDKIKNIKFIVSDLFEKVPKVKFDLIIFNPPYLPKHKHVDDVALVSGKRGVDTTIRFLDSVNNFLKTNGKILLITSSLASHSLLNQGFKKNLLKKKELEKKHIFFEDINILRLTKSDLLKKLESKGFKDSFNFARGKRGVIIKSKLDNKNVSIKIKNENSDAFGNLEIEYKFLKTLNEHNIGPKVISFTDNMLVYEFQNGILIEEYIENNNKQNIIKVLTNVFNQMYTMDELGINKFEMHHPVKHVIIDKHTPVLLDFERCRNTEDPKNISQFCDYMLRISKQLSNKNINFDRDELIELSKEYKKNRTKKNYKKILDFIFS
jgi:release factor glutamine methyltransferase